MAILRYPLTSYGTVLTNGFDSGVLLCSVSPDFAVSATVKTYVSGAVAPPYQTLVTIGTQSNGVLLQYGQSKDRTRNQAIAGAVYLGRPLPVISIGQYDFRQVDLTYKWPSNTLITTFNTDPANSTPCNQPGSSCYRPGCALDKTTPIAEAIRAMELGQMGLLASAGHTLGTKYLIGLQDPSDTIGFADEIILGYIYNVKLSSLTDSNATWREVTLQFLEVGVPA